MNKYDVIIVGTGSGGSMAAKTAAELGLRTIIFERGSKPGEKNSSGCGLGPRMWRRYPEMMEKINIRGMSFSQGRFCCTKLLC
jgi:flavin-dependent dehydrogenase